MKQRHTSYINYDSQYPGYESVESSTSEGRWKLNPQPYTHELPSQEARSITTNANQRKGIAPWLWFAIWTYLIILLGALGFLLWLWFEGRETDSWRRLVLSGWATRAITISGVVIRWAIGSLAAITTAIIASIAVERHGVPLSSLAEISMARFSNRGPESLNKFVPGGAFKIWLRVVIALLFILVVASQFTSTLLVTDLRDLRVNSFYRNMSYGFTFQPIKDATVSTPLPLIGNAFNYWTKKPAVSEIFAEYTQPGNTGEDIDDTGTAIRSFLPVPVQSDRQSLRSFQGLARVIDTRVVCVRPEISVRFCFEPDASYNSFICGNLTASLSNMPQFKWSFGQDGDTDQITVPFQCPVIDSMGNMPGEVHWDLCQLERSLLLASPLTNATANDKTTAFGGNPWLLIDTSSYWKTLTADNNDVLQGNSTWTPLNSTKSGPWLDQWSRAFAEDGETHQDIRLKLSLCYDYRQAAEVDHLNITATTNANHTEPVFGYDYKTNQFDTRAVRNQLDAVSSEERNKSVARQVMTISDEDMQTSLREIQGKPLRSPYISEQSSWIESFLSLAQSRTIAICPICSPDIPQFQTTDVLLAQTFQAVLNQTNSPARAIQAFNTLLFRMIYYDNISSFAPASRPAVVSQFDIVQAPDSIRGLVAVIAIVSGNILLFAVLVVFFRRVAGASFIGDAWHAVAQISLSEDTRPLLEKAKLSTDFEIDCWVHGREMPVGFWANFKDFFKGVGRMFYQGRGDDRFVVQNGLFSNFRGERH